MACGGASKRAGWPSKLCKTEDLPAVERINESSAASRRGDGKVTGGVLWHSPTGGSRVLPAAEPWLSTRDAWTCVRTEFFTPSPWPSWFQLQWLCCRAKCCHGLTCVLRASGSLLSSKTFKQQLLLQLRPSCAPTSQVQHVSQAWGGVIDSGLPPPSPPPHPAG